MSLFANVAIYKCAYYQMSLIQMSVSFDVLMSLSPNVPISRCTDIPMFLIYHPLPIVLCPPVPSLSSLIVSRPQSLEPSLSSLAVVPCFSTLISRSLSLVLCPSSLVLYPLSSDSFLSLLPSRSFPHITCLSSLIPRHLSLVTYDILDILLSSYRPIDILSPRLPSSLYSRLPAICISHFTYLQMSIFTNVAIYKCTYSQMSLTQMSVFSGVLMSLSPNISISRYIDVPMFLVYRPLPIILCLPVLSLSSLDDS